MASRRLITNCAVAYANVGVKALTPLQGVISHAIVQKPVRRALAGYSPAVLRTQRWYSYRSEENTVPGSKIWKFNELKEQVESTKTSDDVVLVDVREPAELLETGKIPGAINIPITSAVQSLHISDADFEDMYGFARPSKDKTLIFYCKAGVRARSAAALAQHAGWSKIGEYPGSWLDWDLNKGPVEVVKKDRN